MNCFECAVRGTGAPAVATCRECGAGLCLDHLADALAYRTGGTVFGCAHDLAAAAAGRATLARPAERNGSPLPAPTPR